MIWDNAMCTETAPSPDDFRKICGYFATGIAIVTTRDAKGQKHGMTVNSFSSVSLAPPLILFSIDQSATAHDIFLNSDEFAVNILSQDQKVLSMQFASLHERDRFEGVKLMDYPEIIAPVLSGCLGTLICRIETPISGGDHTVLIGRVIQILKGEAEDPLLYFKGGYASLKE